MKALQLNISPLTFAVGKTCAAIFGKTSYFRGPGRTVRLREIPEPALPGPEWVKIRTMACGFCGSDLNLIMLHDSPSAQPFTSFPCVMGHEFVGEIVETGSRVSGFSAGSRVAVSPVLSCLPRGLSPLCPACRAGRPGNCERTAEGAFSPGMFLGICQDLSGGFAPYVVAHQSQLFVVPTELNTDAAVMTEPVAVALQTVFDNRPLDAERILVIGGGVIGNLVVQAARALALDCHISVIEPGSFAAGLAVTCGADEIISPGDIFPKTAAITGARLYKPMIGQPVPMGGFDRVYDTVGNAATLNLSMRVLKGLGTLSVVGIGGNVKLDLTPLWLKLQTVKGVYAYGLVDDGGTRRHVFDIALDMMRQKQINAEKLVTHRFRLEEYRRMIEVNMNKGQHQAMKTIVAF
ncbi:MAG: alcohol dehydrogenase catalytic domain-containing protein [Thermodesulfobacteriota bacterium]